MVITGGLEKNLKLNSQGIAINGKELVKCPRNTAPHILVNILKLFPVSPLNTTITNTTFSYIVSGFDGNFSLLCTHLATQILSLEWTMPAGYQ